MNGLCEWTLFLCLASLSCLWDLGTFVHIIADFPCYCVSLMSTLTTHPFTSMFLFIFCPVWEATASAQNWPQTEALRPSSCDTTEMPPKTPGRKWSESTRCARPVPWAAHCHRSRAAAPGTSVWQPSKYLWDDERVQALESSIHI